MQQCVLVSPPTHSALALVEDGVFPPVTKHPHLSKSSGNPDSAHFLYSKIDITILRPIFLHTFKTQNLIKDDLQTVMLTGRCSTTELSF